VRDVEGTRPAAGLVVTAADGEVLITLVAAICTLVRSAAKRIVIDRRRGESKRNKVRLKPDRTGARPPFGSNASVVSVGSGLADALMNVDIVRFFPAMIRTALGTAFRARDSSGAR